MTKFIAIDGEGITINGIHIYNLLGSSDNSYIHNPNGLGTIECFDYLLSLANNNPDSTFVSFYFSYDVNMMLGNLPDKVIKHLGDKGFTYVYYQAYDCLYKIEYIPRKLFKLAKGKWLDKESKHFQAKESIIIWDTFGFFQGSFQTALEQFNIGSKEELENISHMKAQRSSFTEEGLEQVIEYNRLECKLLVELMNNVNMSLMKADINLKSWHGAGAIAAQLMQNHKIKSYLYQPIGEHELAVNSAYFGGRIQALTIGKHKHKVYAHDIISAYPSTITELPSLRYCIPYTIEGIGYDPNLKYVVWKVEWDLTSLTNSEYNEDVYINEYKPIFLTPFPFRDSDGTIHYPLKGKGYYWDCEVRLAMELYGEYITVIKGYGFTIKDKTKPFTFVKELFNQREYYKSIGDNAQLVIKLGLNSLYGKCAQKQGAQGYKPAFQCLIYAGLITAETRTRMLRLACKHPDKIIAFATDGVLASIPLTKNETGLGKWEVKEYDYIFNIKPGFYHLLNNENKSTNRTRGISDKLLDWDKLLAEWNENGIAGEIEIPINQFIGMKIQSEELPWRTWQQSTYKISFLPARGIPRLISKDPVLYRELPPIEISDSQSKPYCVSLFTNNSNIEHEI